MIIPYDSLSPDTLRNVLSTFVTRYDERPVDDNYNMAQKIDSLIASLQAKKAYLSYDEDSESFNLLSPEQAKQLLTDAAF